MPSNRPLSANELGTLIEDLSLAIARLGARTDSLELVLGAVINHLSTITEDGRDYLWRIGQAIKHDVPAAGRVVVVLNPPAGLEHAWD